MMDSQAWEDKFATEDYVFGTEPNAFLRQVAPRLKPNDRVLAVADGEGRNGVWLAEQGCHVLSVDFAANALAKAQRLAASRGVNIETEQADLLHWNWPQGRFQMVVALYIHFPPEHRTKINRAMLAAVEPGGLVVLEAYTPAQLDYGTGGPRELDLLYTADQLHQDFATAEIELLEERIVTRHEGRFEGRQAAVVRLLARRPGGC